MPAVSLFSGAGGMDVGITRAGFEIDFANDLDPAACETYRLNHSDAIRNGPLEEFLSSLRQFRGAELVFGGPPCQGFSVAGKMNPNDIRNELIFKFFEAVEIVAPTAFICENVKALASLSRWQSIRDALIERAKKLGYLIDLVVLNSAEFGVPQTRERMFLVGFNPQFLGLEQQEFSHIFRQSLHAQKRQGRTVADVIRSLGPAGTEGNSRSCKAKITFARNPVLRRSPYAGMLFNGAGRPLNPLRQAPTLPASMGGNKTPIIDEELIFNNSENFVEHYHAYLISGGNPYQGTAPECLRRLTVDECLAIQTFPAGYYLAGKQSAMYRQIGNAVPCDLAHSVANVVRHFLDNGPTPLLNPED